MTVTQTIVLLVMLLCLMAYIVSHWSGAIWEPREFDEEGDDMNCSLSDDMVFFDEEYAETECGAWFFRDYVGQKWGPFKTENIARVNHRNYLTVIEPDEA